MAYYEKRRDADKAEARALLGLDAGGQPAGSENTASLSNRKKKQLERQQEQERQKKPKTQPNGTGGPFTCTKRMPELGEKIFSKIGLFIKYCKDNDVGLIGQTGPCLRVNLTGSCSKKGCSHRHEALPDHEYNTFWEAGQKFLDSL